MKASFVPARSMSSRLDAPARVSCAVWLVAVLAAITVLDGCKKRETKPAPQVVAIPAASAGGGRSTPPAVPTPAASDRGQRPGGIAWFQGGFEEGFSRTPGQGGAPAPAGCLQPFTDDADCRGSAWGQSIRMLPRLLQSVRLGL